MGAYVDLLEYKNIEGMILLSELSRRRIRSMNKLIKIGKTEPVVVIRVDKDKGMRVSNNVHIFNRSDNPSVLNNACIIFPLININGQGLLENQPQSKAF